MIIMLLLWMIGIYSVYLHSHFTMLKRGNDQVIGEHKAVFELANAMQTQLEQESKEIDLSVLTEKQLRRRITKNLNGGSISFKTTVSLGNTTNTDKDNLINTHTPFRFITWLKEEKWWFISTVSSFGVVIFMPVTFKPFSLFPLLPLELPFIVYVGQTGRSRAILSFGMFWFFCVRGVIPFVLLLSKQIEQQQQGYDVAQQPTSA
jgi:hypothetical protein